jgi:hypothetical protein
MPSFDTPPAPATAPRTAPLSSRLINTAIERRDLTLLGCPWRQDLPFPSHPARRGDGAPKEWHPVQCWLAQCFSAEEVSLGTALGLLRELLLHGVRAEEEHADDVRLSDAPVLLEVLCGSPGVHWGVSSSPHRNFATRDQCQEAIVAYRSFLVEAATLLTKLGGARADIAAHRDTQLTYHIPAFNVSTRRWAPSLRRAAVAAGTSVFAVAALQCADYPASADLPQFREFAGAVVQSQGQAPASPELEAALWRMYTSGKHSGAFSVVAEGGKRGDDGAPGANKRQMLLPLQDAALAKRRPSFCATAASTAASAAAAAAGAGAVAAVASAAAEDEAQTRAALDKAARLFEQLDEEPEAKLEPPPAGAVPVRALGPPPPLWEEGRSPPGWASAAGAREPHPRWRAALEFTPPDGAATCTVLRGAEGPLFAVQPTGWRTAARDRFVSIGGTSAIMVSSSAGSSDGDGTSTGSDGARNSDSASDRSSPDEPEGLQLMRATTEPHYG